MSKGCGGEAQRAGDSVCKRIRRIGRRGTEEIVQVDKVLGIQGWRAEFRSLAAM